MPEHAQPRTGFSVLTPDSQPGERASWRVIWLVQVEGRRVDPFSFGALALAVVAATSAIVLSQKRSPASPANGAAPESQAHRFLCPHCLRFGLFRHACGGCGSPIDPLVVRTQGQLANTCTVCRRPLFARGARRGPAPLATCHRCGEGCDPTVYHERAIRLVGVLGKSDFAAFRRQAGPKWSYRSDHAAYDDGRTLIYVLDLTALDADAAADPRHARASLNALWFGPSLAAPLELGERLDQFLRHFPREAVEELRILAAPENPEPAGANVLGARFPHAEYGVAPAKLAAALHRQSTPKTGVAPPLTLAVLTEDDLARLAATTDLDGRPILNRSGQGRSPRHGAIRVVCSERVAEERREHPGAVLLDAAALWIGGEPTEVDELEAQIQGLFRAMGLPHSRADDMVVCLEGPHPHAATLALLESRFGRVETGVPPQEFLARGAEARGWILTGRAPVRTRAVLNGTDLWVLGEAMDPRHRHDLGGGWLCEAAPARVNYVLNLDAPDRTPGSFFATPDTSEIEAIWIHLAAREPLVLAEYLDRMDRIPGLRAAERDDVVACVSHDDLSSAIRNVLEARFTRVHCGVSAEAFLAGGRGHPLPKDEG